MNDKSPFARYLTPALLEALDKIKSGQLPPGEQIYVEGIIFTMLDPRHFRMEHEKFCDPAEFELLDD